MNDIVFIKNLRIDTIIGIYDWERNTKQTISLDIEMLSDIDPATKSDDIKDALNYKAVAKRLIGFVEQSRFNLVETLAEKIANIILTEFAVHTVKLTLNKGKALTGADGVGVQINRSK